MLDPTLCQELEEAGVRLVCKDQSRLMGTIGILLRFVGNPRFMDGFWTTLGRTIYYPRGLTQPERCATILRHELVHVRQFERYGVLLMGILYLLVPLPFGFSYFRWRFEREAYLVNLAAGERPSDLAHRLWTGYGWPWPKTWMERWFERHQMS